MGSANPAALEIEKAAKAAELGVRPGPAGGARERLDPVHEAVAGVDVDPGVGIGERFAGFGHRGSRSRGPATA